MSKIINCKTCNEEMAASAKMCPKCGAKNKKPFYKKWWVWVIAVIVLIAIFSGGSGDDVSKTGGNNTKTSESKTQTMYAVNDIITTDKFEITVTEIKTAKQVGGPYIKTQPAEGGIYVIVNWEYKNISDNPISSFSTPMLKLVDKNDVSYDSDFEASTYYATEANLDSKVLSDLNPGIKVKDAEVFEISEESYNAGGFKIKIDADKDFEIKVN